MNVATELAGRLLAIKAIKLSPQDPFTWASGLRSPIYCDNRLTLSYPMIRDFIKEAFAVAVKEQWPTANLIAGVATAGIPHGALIADRMQLPLIYVRSKAKEHGRQNLIEGTFEPGASAVVIEDLISTGGSSIQAVQALRAAGIKVLGVISIFDYQLEKSKENFAAADCPYLALSNYQTLLGEAIKINYISEEEKKLLVDWNKNPESWYTNNY